MKLLNVRLGPDDSRIVAKLRKEGVQISRIVREAIRSAYTARQTVGGKRRRPSDIMAEIYAEYPDPRLWTYDREFRTTWRRPDGTAIPLATRRP